MPEVIDNEARERVAELDKRFMELSTDYWGPRRDNGTRSMVREHATKLDTLEREMRHYVDTRPDTCLGLKALAEHESSHEEVLYEEGKEEADMQIAKDGDKTKRYEVRMNLLGVLLAALFVLAGQVVTAQQNRVTQAQIVTLTHVLEKGGQP